MNIDLLIIGGGAAGLSAAQYGARQALKTLCVEQLSFGGQALFIDVLENYPAGGTAAGALSGDAFAASMQKQAESFGAILRNAGVDALKKSSGGMFEAQLDDGLVVEAKAVILAMGAGHKLLEVEGEDTFAGRGVSYCASCDGPFFKNKKIFVAGGGDAACTEAEFLARLSSDVTILVRRDKFRAQKALVERVLRNKSIKIRYNTKVSVIKGGTKVQSLVLEESGGAKTEEAADALFVFAGIVPRNDLLVNGLFTSHVELDAAGFVKTDSTMKTSVPGVFAAGDLRASPFRQVVTACADGAIAAHSAASFIAEQAIVPIKDM